MYLAGNQLCPAWGLTLHGIRMQFQTPIHRAAVHHPIEQLLDVVETRMLESISAHAPQAARVSSPFACALDAASYHLSAGGQRIRAKLALHAALALGLTVSDAVSLATTVELLHNASLVHDDIQDQDLVRRGRKSVWAHFGVNTAICTGDLLLSAAYAALCKLEQSHALAAMIGLIHERTATAIDGQCADLTAHAHVAPDAASAVARYQQIAVAKSGALLCLPIELALLASREDRHLADARRAVEAFAVGYQIVDDLNDVQSDTGPDAASSTFNIVSICKAFSGSDAALADAKQIGLHNLNTAIQSAMALPCGSGALLIDHASGLRKLLVEQY